MNNKKLLYVVRYRLDNQFNLKAKFDGQICAFENLGFDVYYIAFDERHFYLMNGQQKQVIGKTRFGIPGYFHTLCYQDLYTLACRTVREIGFDCVYWRSAALLPASLWLAKEIKRSGARFIYEYPTYPASTEKAMSTLRAIYGAYSSKLCKKVDNLADGFVLIGEDAHGVYNGKPAVNISNGVNLEVVPLRKPVVDPDTVHILALASMCYWHGYDRLIRSLAEYNGDRAVQIHMVGGNDGGCIPEWKELTISLGLQDKVIFHGPMSGDALRDMFDLCDVGVNSLGMYRKGFSVTSELKVREYAARGLPFVCSVPDPVLEQVAEPMWLWVSNDESAPDMARIVDFALRMRADHGSAEKLRAYAGEYLTWEAQYRQVFETFKLL